MSNSKLIQHSKKEKKEKLASQSSKREKKNLG